MLAWHPQFESTRMSFAPRLIAIPILALGMIPAHAQYVPMDFTSQTFNSMNISVGALLNRSLIDTTPSKNEPVSAPSRRSTTTTIGRSDAARELAKAFPAAQRTAAEQSFGQLLAEFRDIETQIGVPHGDVAVAMACVVIGSYEAYHDRTLDPSTYEPVILQLREVMSVNPQFAALGSGERRAVYERLAILGTYVLRTRLSLSQSPSSDTASKLRAAATKYLSELQLDPDAIEIDASGIRLR